MKMRLKLSTFIRLAVLCFIGEVLLMGVSSVVNHWIPYVAAIALCVAMFALIAVTDFRDELGRRRT